MDNPFAKNPEKSDHQPSEPKEGGKKNDSHELKEIGSGLSEIVEGLDVAEVSDNEVSEGEQKGKSKLGGGSIKGASGSAATSAKPFIPPSLEVMRTQIGVRIKKEIAVLKQEAAIATKNFDPEKLTVIVSRIRSLKEILSNLAFAGSEALKNWWLKMVKDNTI